MNLTSGTSSTARVGVRESALAARRSLAEEREKLRLQHASGSPGIQVCARLSDYLDSLLIEIFAAALVEFDPDYASFIRSNVALVPLGGFGRRDLAPFSDVDLMLLHEAEVVSEVEPIARRLVTDVSDLGLQLGFSVRSIPEACKLGRRDAVIFTSLAEARYLAGSVRLFSKFMRRFRQTTRNRPQALMQMVVQARESERSHYDETVFLLEPDVKKSVGALRDIHLIRWIGFASYGECVPANLRLQGRMTRDDERDVRRAYEFLLRLRNEMHFHAGRSLDVLRKSDQVRIAEAWGYAGDRAVLPVERFMQEYFDHTCRVRDISEYFVANARGRSVVTRLFGYLVSHNMDGRYRVGPVHIAANRDGLAQLQGNLVEVLRLMELANQTNKKIAHDTWTAIREDMTQQPNLTVSAEAARRFVSLLHYTSRLGQLLRRLHELRVLEKLIAGMDHARHLLQFNAYHKYTVDEHCIRAVERASEFFSDLGPLGRAYRKVKRRSILHLALLIHDVGKGYSEDHSEVGRRLAGETAARLKLSPSETEILEFLVHKHLLMAHLAFRRDTSDEAIVIQFAQEVGSPELLRMLFVMTAADLAAVGPDVLNPWKVEVLSELYQRAMYHLGGRRTSFRSERLADDRRQGIELHSHGPRRRRRLVARTQIRALPDTYVSRKRQARGASTTCSASAALGTRSKPIAWGRYPNGATQFRTTRSVCQSSRSFLALCTAWPGVMSSKGLAILSGSLHRMAEGFVLYRF